ncbi:MAG: formylglycine-generating enzyme family protein [Phycisphaerales bacterium]
MTPIVSLRPPLDRRRATRMRSGVVAIAAAASGSFAMAAAAAALPALASQAAPARMATPEPSATKSEAFAEPIPEAATELKMMPIPASADGAVGPFWMSTTEVPWEVFDVFLFRLDLDQDEEADQWADTESRPSKPYLPPDRGFGHDGYATISVTHHACVKFCEWLSERTGRHYRLATEAEWEHAARGGAAADALYFFGDDIEQLSEFAWYKGNTRRRPQRIGKKPANPYGLHDIHGNVAEWVNVPGEKPVTKGGSYADTPRKLEISARARQNSTWNSTDPQLPKSTWWLSDGPFVGFRIVCDPNPPAATPTDEAAAETGATDEPEEANADGGPSRPADG